MKTVTNDRPDSIHAEWVLSNVCNYRCNYCGPKLYSGTSGWPDLQKSLDFWRYVHTDVNSNAKMLTISGGEPTLWPNLSVFLNNLDDSYEKAIVTNGSRTIRWWQKFIKKTTVTQITISIHLEYASEDHISEVIKTIGPYTRVTVLLMLDENSIDKGKQFVNKLVSKDLYCKIIIKPITRRWNSNNETQKYNNDTLEWIKSFNYNKDSPAFKKLKRKTAVNIVIDGEEKPVFYMNEMISKNMNRFKGWRCYAGTHRLVVWHDGNVYGAQCSTAKKNLLGNISNGKLDKKIVPLICNTEYCVCIPDIRIPKEKI